MDYSKETKESLGFGVIFTTIKTTYEYLVYGKKPTMVSVSTSLVLGASADVVYDYGKLKKWWPWI